MRRTPLVNAKSQAIPRRMAVKLCTSAPCPAFERIWLDRFTLQKMERHQRNSRELGKKLVERRLMCVGFSFTHRNRRIEQVRARVVPSLYRHGARRSDVEACAVATCDA